MKHFTEFYTTFDAIRQASCSDPQHHYHKLQQPESRVDVQLDVCDYRTWWFAETWNWESSSRAETGLSLYLVCDCKTYVWGMLLHCICQKKFFLLYQRRAFLLNFSLPALEAGERGLCVKTVECTITGRDDAWLPCPHVREEPKERNEQK